MNRRRALVMVPAAAMLFGALAAAPAMASDMLEVGQEGTLVARGVAVDIPLEYSCTSTNEWFPGGNMSVEVAQLVRGQKVAFGHLEFQVDCDGEPGIITARVTVDAGSPAFKNGTALVDASLFIPSDTGTISTSQVVRISR